uniref:Putative secreted protein n=1 Tax=Anopheles darlingi TaxID=43151 RepID=A0A2M4D2G8_ANODA
MVVAVDVAVAAVAAVAAGDGAEGDADDAAELNREAAAQVAVPGGKDVGDVAVALVVAGAVAVPVVADGTRDVVGVAA